MKKIVSHLLRTFKVFTKLNILLKFIHPPNLRCVEPLQRRNLLSVLGRMYSPFEGGKGDEKVVRSCFGLGKTITKNALLLLLVLSLFTACEKDFEEINQNPFDPTETSIGALFNTVVSSLRMSNEEQLYLNNETLYAITQQAALTESSFPAYSIGTETVWKNYYKALAHIRAIEERIVEMETEMEPEALNNVKGMVKIITAYKTFRMTDLFGDMPFFEAGKAYQGIEFSRPAFDDQETIYKFLLEELAWAATNMVATSNPITESGTPYVTIGNFDTLFDGVNLDWIAFANSLRLRYAVRMYEKEPALAQEIITDILDNALPLIREGGEVVMKPANQGWARTSSYYGYYNSTGPFNSGLRLGSTMWNELADGTSEADIFDPRAFIFFETNHENNWAVYPQIPNDNTPETGGSPYALIRDANHAFKGQDNIFSPVNFYLIRDEQDVPEILLTGAEVYFLLSEIYLRGLGVPIDEGTADGYYVQGVVASLQFWQRTKINSAIWENASSNLTQGDMYELTNHPRLSIFETTDKLNLIYTQRWIDAFLQPWEAYSLLRRTEATPREGAIPMHYRFPYPPSEGIDNVENWSAQVAKMGEDSETVKVWWMTF